MPVNLLNIFTRFFATVLFFLPVTHASSEDSNFLDLQLKEEIEYPEWFKYSSGDLSKDLALAKTSGKQGIMIYFGQNRCSYCQQFLSMDIGKPDIEKYIRENFDIIVIDIWSINTLSDFDGIQYTERQLSIKYQTNFTPSLLFYKDKDKPAFKLRGLYPPYIFRAALEYVVEDFYKGESFREYLERAESGMFFYHGDLYERDFFQPAKILQTRKYIKSTKPLVVFFEQGHCHACDLLHSGPLSNDKTIAAIKKMDAVQLNMWSDTVIKTPQGENLSAKQWATNLGIFHTPTLLFFNYKGDEVFRIDSVVQLYRLRGVLDYVNKQGYLTEPDYQSWRLKQRKVK